MACPGCLEGCAAERFEVLVEQPVSTEATIDGVFFKTLVLPDAGTMVPQHSHRHAHLTAVVSGAVRVWVEGKRVRDYHAPAGVLIGAELMHNFLTLAPDTVLACIHDVSQGRTVQIVAQNRLPGGV